MNKGKLYFLRFAKVWIIYSLSVCIIMSLISFCNLFLNFIIDSTIITKISDIIILSLINAVLYSLARWYVKNYE